jgi:RPA family protein
MPEQIKRNTAYKLRIGDLDIAEKITDQEKFIGVELNNKKVRRVNIVANVIERFQSEGEKQYLAITIDDASGQIKIKTFGDEVPKFSEISQGDTILVIGTLREYNNEVYILPEIIRTIDPRYLLVRKLELQTSAPEIPKQEIKDIKEQIKDMIKKSEEQGGIEADKIVMEIKANPEAINNEIKKLLEQGVVYEPRPGKLRFLG